MKYLKKFEADENWLSEPINPNHNSDIEEIKEVLDEMKDELDGFESSVIMYYHNNSYRVEYSIPNKLSFGKGGNVVDAINQIEKSKKVMDHYMELSNDVLKRLDGMGYQINFFDTSHQVRGLSQSEYRVLHTVLGVSK